MDISLLMGRISTEYESRIKDRKRKFSKIMLKIFMILFVTIVTIFFIYSILGIKFMNVLTLTIFGSLLLIWLITYFIGKSIKSSRPFYDYLLNEIVNNYNLDLGTFYDYDSKIKVDKEINKLGGLFSRMAQNSIKFRIKGLKDNVSFSIDQSYLYTSSGQSTTVYLKGVYLFIGLPEPNIQQIRERWKPALKGVKFTKQFDDKRVFLAEGSYVDTKYIKVYEDLKTRYPESKVYVSANQSGIHIGLDKVWFKPLKKLDEVRLRTLNDDIRKLVDITNYLISELSDAF